MKSIKICILFLLISGTLHALDVYDEIANAIRSGDAKQIATFFSSSIDLTIMNREDVYSKAQAELIVRDFLMKNVPKSFSILHKGSSKEGTLYAIGNLATMNGKMFRTSFFVKMSAGKYQIQELRFESQ